MKSGPTSEDAARVEGWDRTRSPRHRPGPGRRIGLVAIPIAILVIVAFSPALDNGFVNWDDDTNLRDNPCLRAPGLAPIGWAWTTFHLGVYQPIAWWLFEAEYHLWGLDARGYHLTSILLHAACSVVLYAMTMALLSRCRTGPGPGSPWIDAAAAGLATLVFAVHPLRVEVVAWASCQPYLPCALFSMLAVLAYLRATEADDRARRAWLAAALALFVAAMVGHAVAISLPAVLLILDVYPLRRTGPRVWREKVPFVLASLVFMGLAVAARSVGVFSARQLDAPARIAQACYGVWFYLIKTFWPVDLVAVYPLPRRIEWRAWPFLPAILGTFGVVVVLFALRRRWPGLLAAWLCYLAILAPTSGLIRASDQIAADRYSYLSTTVWVIAAAAGLARLGRFRPAAMAGVVAMGLAAVAGLVVLSRAQCRTWRDSPTLWTHALSRPAGVSSVAHYDLGHYLLERGDPRGAAAHYAAALRIDPDKVSVHHNLGIALSQLGRHTEAAAQYAEVIRLEPRFATAHFNLGVIRARQGRLDEAEAHYRDALRLEPNAVDTHYNLAMILSSRGKYAEAEAHYLEALRLDPGLAGAHNNLGTDLARQGRLAEAEAHYNEVLRLDPRRTDTHSNLGVILSRQGKLDAAAAHFAEARRLDPGHRARPESPGPDRTPEGAR